MLPLSRVNNHSMSHHSNSGSNNPVPDDDSKYYKATSARNSFAPFQLPDIAYRIRWSRVFALLLAIFLINLYFKSVNVISKSGGKDIKKPVVDVDVDVDNFNFNPDDNIDNHENENDYESFSKWQERRKNQEKVMDSDAAVKSVNNGNEQHVASIKAGRRGPKKMTEPEMEGKKNKNGPKNQEDDSNKITSSNPKSDKFGSLWEDRKNSVVDAFKHAWKGYVRDAFGFDHLKPISKRGEDWFQMGLTIVDSLDTMYLMGLTGELEVAEKWVKDHLFFEHNNHDVNLFETTIRVLGSLLSMHHFTGKEMYLEKAIDLADRLLCAFESSPTAIPFATVQLGNRRGILSTLGQGESSTAEVATIQLEFRYLSHLTKNEKYKKAADAVIQRIQKLEKYDGLVPIFISPTSGEFVGREIRLGSRGDSYYEYLLKQYLQTGKSETHFWEMYQEAMDGVQKHLVIETKHQKYVFIGELLHGKDSMSIHPKMDHLVCFMAGNLVLGATQGKKLSHSSLDQKAKAQFQLGLDLCRTCFEMYNQTATGLAPEIVYFHQPQEDPKSPDDMFIQSLDRHNLLRPETVESLFIIYQITGDTKYREWGWAFEKYSKIEDGGYTCLNDVTKIPPPPRDMMESFYLAETLKYLYLLFNDDEPISLEKYVFNTEAHPFPIITPAL